MSEEVCVAAAYAAVMVYSEPLKQWETPRGCDGVHKVEIMRHLERLSFRIVSQRETDGACIINCNIHQRLKYHPARATFHQWRDESRQVYGLNFESDVDARNFVTIIGHIIDQLNHQPQTDYQSIHTENVYQDPHQHHIAHNHSAPTFGEHHDENQNANFRKSSQQVASTLNGLSQQQRRASQSSNASGGPAASNLHMYNMDQQDSRGGFWNGAAPTAQSAPAPPSSAVPPAPPLPPISSNAPPPPPPPPPAFANGAAKAVSLADQLKMKSAALNKTTGPRESRPSVDSTGAIQAASSQPAPVPAAASGSLMSELAATINKRKMTQAKADAVDSKSNTSNASSDSGCAIPSTVNGLSNGVKKLGAEAKVNGNAPLVAVNGSDSPKTHRKIPSASSIFSQEDPKGANVGSISELLEKFKADLMLEVKLEIGKAKQDIIEALRAELAVVRR